MHSFKSSMSAEKLSMQLEPLSEELFVYTFVGDVLVVSN